MYYSSSIQCSYYQETDDCVHQLKTLRLQYCFVMQCNQETCSPEYISAEIFTLELIIMYHQSSFHKTCTWGKLIYLKLCCFCRNYPDCAHSISKLEGISAKHWTKVRGC